MNLLINNASNLAVDLHARYWLHDVEYITCDASSGIYWKGQLIDFIRDPEREFYQETINDLAVQCRHLEAIHVPINIETVVHFGDWFSVMHDDYQYKKLLMNCPDIRVSGRSKIIFIQGNYIAEYANNKWAFYHKSNNQTDVEWSYFWGQQALINRGYKGLSLSYSDLDCVNYLLEHFNVPINLFD
jgi:hypothetical protein